MRGSTVLARSSESSCSRKNSFLFLPSGLSLNAIGFSSSGHIFSVFNFADSNC